MAPGVPGSCVLAIVSLVDIDDDIPSKPHTSGPGQAGVIATWGAVSNYVQVLSDFCLVRRSELGWMSYGKQTTYSFCALSVRINSFWMFADRSSHFTRLLEDSTLGIFLWATDSAINQHVPRPDRDES